MQNRTSRVSTRALAIAAIALSAASVAHAGTPTILSFYNLPPGTTSTHAPINAGPFGIIVAVNEPSGASSANNLTQLGLAFSSPTVHTSAPGHTLLAPTSVSPTGLTAFLEISPAGDTTPFSLILTTGASPPIPLPLLLPAVQRVREAAARSSTTGGNIVYLFADASGATGLSSINPATGVIAPIFVPTPSLTLQTGFAANGDSIALRAINNTTGRAELHVIDTSTSAGPINLAPASFTPTGRPSLNPNQVVSAGEIPGTALKKAVLHVRKQGGDYSEPFILPLPDTLTSLSPALNTRGDLVTLATAPSGTQSLLFLPAEYLLSLPLSPAGTPTPPPIENVPWQTLLSTGDLFAGSTLSSILWDSGGIGDDGSATFAATFTSGQSAIYTIAIPEPSAALPLLAAAPLLISRRRPTSPSPTGRTPTAG